MKRPNPAPATVAKMTRYVEKYWEKTGTNAHPEPEVAKAVILGLAANVEEVAGRSVRVIFMPIKTPSWRSTAVLALLATK